MGESMDDTTSLVKKNPAAFPVGVMAGLHGTQIGLMIRQEEDSLPGPVLFLFFGQSLR